MKADTELHRKAKEQQQRAKQRELSDVDGNLVLGEGALVRGKSGLTSALPFPSKTRSMTTRDGKVFEVLVPIAKNRGGSGSFGSPEEKYFGAEPGGSIPEQETGAKMKSKSESARAMTINSVLVVLMILGICIWV